PGAPDQGGDGPVDAQREPLLHPGDVPQRGLHEFGGDLLPRPLERGGDRLDALAEARLVVRGRGDVRPVTAGEGLGHRCPFSSLARSRSPAPASLRSPSAASRSRWGVASSRTASAAVRYRSSATCSVAVWSPSSERRARAAPSIPAAAAWSSPLSPRASSALAAGPPARSSSSARVSVRRAHSVTAASTRASRSVEAVSS